ncbi:MAG: phage head-tail adapter protein [Clostridia bacterium]|nr:phage head-tail adapter protein [Clostridia bacterium]
MHETEIKLISYISTGTDEMAQPIKTRIETPILAIDVPVSRSDYYQAGQNGILPEFEFLINPAEYNGEEEAEIEDRNGNPISLKIYRTYDRNPDQLEIYCHRASGLNRRET